jgi:hypothetical protein
LSAGGGGIIRQMLTKWWRLVVPAQILCPQWKRPERLFEMAWGMFLWLVRPSVCAETVLFQWQVRDSFLHSISLGWVHMGNETTEHISGIDVLDLGHVGDENSMLM